MRFRLQLITVGEDGSERMHSVAELEPDSTLRLETTGLTLAEGKQILKHVQEVVLQEQVQACLIQHRHCPICSKPHSTKGHHQIRLQTVFGNLQTAVGPRIPETVGKRNKRRGMIGGGFVFRTGHFGGANSIGAAPAVFPLSDVQSPFWLA